MFFCEGDIIKGHKNTENTWVLCSSFCLLALNQIFSWCRFVWPVFNLPVELIVSVHFVLLLLLFFFFSDGKPAWEANSDRLEWWPNTRCCHEVRLKINLSYLLRRLV